MTRWPILQSTFGEAGTVAIEYGLVLPVMLLFTFGIMDTGRLLWTYVTLTEATETAARCWAVNTTTCPTAASIPAYAATQANAMGLSGVTATNFTSSTSTCGAQVVGTYTYAFFTPWFPQFSTKAPFGSATSTLTAKACYPVQ